MVAFFWRQGPGQLAVLEAGAEQMNEDDAPLEPLPRDGNDLVSEARSLGHLLTHMPKNHGVRHARLPKCSGGRARDALGVRPALFGEQITADHIVARSERSQGVTGQEDALLVTD